MHMGEIALRGVELASRWPQDGLKMASDTIKMSHEGLRLV